MASPPCAAKENLCPYCCCCCSPASRLLPRARVARRATIAVVAFAAAAAAGCALGRAQPDPPLTPVRVTRVVDGDTIEAQAGGRRERVRLLGIDTPELRGPGGAECGAAPARANLRRLTRPGRSGGRVRLQTDPDSGDVRDRYGRLLAYADGPHGDLGKAQVRAGLALVYRHRGRNFSRLVRYRRAEAAARARRRGIWSACPEDRSHDGPLTTGPAQGRGQQLTAAPATRREGRPSRAPGRRRRRRPRSRASNL